MQLYTTEEALWNKVKYMDKIIKVLDKVLRLPWLHENFALYRRLGCIGWSSQNNYEVQCI